MAELNDVSFNLISGPGVLTKMDRVEEARQPTVLEMFNNGNITLDHGWFTVKLPSGDDIPWEEARNQEREFFQDNEPWKSIRTDDRNRLGSEQLTQYISKLLSSLVAARCDLQLVTSRLQPHPCVAQASRYFSGHH